ARLVPVGRPVPTTPEAEDQAGRTGTIPPFHPPQTRPPRAALHGLRIRTPPKRLHRSTGSPAPALRKDPTKQFDPAPQSRPESKPPAAVERRAAPPPAPLPATPPKPRIRREPSSRQ